MISRRNDFPTDVVNAELDKMLKAKNQAIGLYESMEAERAKFAAKERVYEDLPNKMGKELEAKSTSELRLLDNNRALKIWGKCLPEG